MSLDVIPSKAVSQPDVSAQKVVAKEWYRRYHIVWMISRSRPSCKLEIKGQHLSTEGFPGGASGKEPTCQNRRHKRRGFDP